MSLTIRSINGLSDYARRASVWHDMSVEHIPETDTYVVRISGRENAIDCAGVPGLEELLCSIQDNNINDALHQVERLSHIDQLVQVLEDYLRCSVENGSLPSDVSALKYVRYAESYVKNIEKKRDDTVLTSLMATIRFDLFRDLPDYALPDDISATEYLKLVPKRFKQYQQHFEDVVTKEKAFSRET